ncbi:hypothetical protein B0H17DRAFT_949080, partial [Mycena rosella]
MDQNKNVDYTSRIPTEIWLRCWSTSLRYDLKGLVLVCRYFRAICQPLLFQHQRFRAPSVEDI